MLRILQVTPESSRPPDGAGLLGAHHCPGKCTRVLCALCTHNRFFQFYSKLREYIRQGEEMNPQYLAMYDSLMAGETNYHSSDVKTLRVKLLKVAENIDLMSKKIQALGVDNSQEVQEGMAKPRRFALQDQVRRASINFIKETLVGLPSLPSDDELVKIQERRKMEIARQLEENRRKREEAQAKYQAMQEKRKLEADRTKSSSLPRSGSGGKFNKSKVSLGLFRTDHVT